MIWSCEGGTITKQPSFGRVIVETDADKDIEIVLTAYATSARKEAVGEEPFTHKHTIEGQGTSQVKVETDGAGSVPLSLDVIVDEIFGTADFEHQHPKLESFATLKKQHAKEHGGIQRSGTG